MKNPAQIIILIILLGGGFWIGIKWGEMSREKKIQEQLDAIMADRTTPGTSVVTTPTSTSTVTDTSSATPTTIIPTPTEIIPAEIS